MYEKSGISNGDFNLIDTLIYCYEFTPIEHIDCWEIGAGIRLLDGVPHYEKG